MRIGWFATARGSTSRTLLAAVQHAIQSGKLQAEIVYVFCSREAGESSETDQFLEQARSYGIPLITESFERHRQAAGSKGLGLSSGSFASWREAYDRRVLSLVEANMVDVVLQAGYMLVWTPLLCERLRGLNLHPAAPGGPAGTWQQVIWQLIDQRATSSGVYLHRVTPHLDQGPVATFCQYPIDTADFTGAWRQIGSAPAAQLREQYGEDLPLFQQIRSAGVQREAPLILATLGALAEGELLALADLAGDAPLDLTTAIERELSTRAASTS